MPAVLSVVAPLQPGAVDSEPIHVSRAGRECPVCALAPCASPHACMAEFPARAWIDCGACAGTGWDTTGMAIWCRTCGGSKVLEGGA